MKRDRLLSSVFSTVEKRRKIMAEVNTDSTMTTKWTVQLVGGRKVVIDGKLRLERVSEETNNCSKLLKKIPHERYNTSRDSTWKYKSRNMGRTFLKNYEVVPKISDMEEALIKILHILMIVLAYGLTLDYS